MLLRPAPEQTGRLHVAWDIRRGKGRNVRRSGGQRVSPGTNHRGRTIRASGRAPTGVWIQPGPLSAGAIWIVWAANPRLRWQIEVPAGQKTEVRFRLNPSGEIADPQIARTGPAAPPTGNRRNTAKQRSFALRQRTVRRGEMKIKEAAALPPDTQ